METVEHRPILRRAGVVLIVVGLLDVVLMVYGILSNMAYTSGFNVLAVVAGIFLMRSSLRAASLVRWLAVFTLAGCASLVIAWPFVQPIDFTLTQLRLSPLLTIGSLGVAVVLGLVLFWLYRELGHVSVLAAQVAAGRPVRDMRIPAVVGICVVVALAVFMGLLLGGEAAMKAKAIAAKQLGAKYRYHVTSLSISSNSQGTFVSGTVAAWNDTEIQNVSVEWEER